VERASAKEVARAMTLVELRFVRDPRDPCWELWPASPGMRTGLIDWLLEDAPVDAGVPPDVAELICQALCRSRRVTFLDPRAEETTSPAWSAGPDGWTRVLQPTLFGRMSGRPRYPLLCTEQPERAAELFSTEGFSWVQKGQIALLSRASGPPPELGHAQIDAIFRREPIGRIQLGLPADIEALLLPAVDGDYAQLIALEEVHRKRIIDDLASACSDADLRWSIVEEKALFVERRRGAWA
jgi:hypothetical protein